MRKLITLTLTLIASIVGFSQDTIKVTAIDTFQVMLLISECELCTPQTTLGYVIAANAGTKEKPDWKQSGYLMGNGKPPTDNVVIWAMHARTKRK